MGFFIEYNWSVKGKHDLEMKVLVFIAHITTIGLNR